ncbi:MAG: type VI secretion system baseplate subunit TssF [Burkholderiaceae bacterium]
MDPRLLRYYNQELRYLREMGAEFAREFPKIAGRLGMDGIEVADPYVERLLEGCAFLAARVQLKQDAEFPQLAQRLLEMVSPNFTAPLPSMTVVQFQPLPDPNLLKGYALPRGTALRGPRTALGDTRCEFRTAQPVVLDPLQVVSAEYFLNASDLNLAALPLRERPRCGVRVRLKLPEGMAFAQLEQPSLRFYLGGMPDTALRLYEQLIGACIGVLAGAPSKGGARAWLDPASVRPVGYDDDEAMLPITLRGLSGTRLMQEYFGFPQRFLFIDVADLGPALVGCSGSEFELAFLFSRPGIGLEGVLEAANFSLHCAPAVNLFERRADRLSIDDGDHAFHVVPERGAPMDFEVYDVTAVTGYGEGEAERTFRPLFEAPHGAPPGTQAYYSALREPRLVSDKARRDGPRSGYIGTEVFLSLVDPLEAPYSETMQQLAVRIRCTNRDLPLFMPLGGAADDFTLDVGAPVSGIRAIAGPSRPHSAAREGAIAWKLLNLLSLNYLSLLDTDPQEGAVALRELLGLYARGAEPGLARQIEGLRHVSVKPVVRRHPVKGPIAFGRGIEVTLTVDDLAFEGGSAVLLGSVLHRYLSRHVSMNSFVQTVVVSLLRGELARWAPIGGARPVV